MLQLLLPLIVLAAAECHIHGSTAASAAQVRFAIENKYDDTGPGAKRTEYAYHTYKNLDDALVAYLNDPDTKLPDHERAKAIARLYQLPKSKTRVDAFTGNLQKQVPILLSTYNKEAPLSVFDVAGGRRDPHKWQKLHLVKASPLSIAHYNKELDNTVRYKPDPSVYNYNYDVHDKETGDLKSAQEMQDGSGAIHGYYTVVDKNGQRRTVQYLSDPARGYRTTVHRVFHN